MIKNLKLVQWYIKNIGSYWDNIYIRKFDYRKIGISIKL